VIAGPRSVRELAEPGKLAQGEREQLVDGRDPLLVARRDLAAAGGDGTPVAERPVDRGVGQ
jgi:hypothetical protein